MRGNIARRFILGVVSVGFIVFSLGFGFSLWIEKDKGKRELERHMQEIQRTVVPALTLSAWTSSTAMMQAQVDGIASMPYVESVELHLDSNQTLRAGSLPSEKSTKYEFNIEHEFNGRQIHIGSLVVSASTHRLDEALQRNAIYLVISRGVEALVIVLFVSIFFHIFIYRKLRLVSSYAENITPDNIHQPLVLPPGNSSGDELDVLALSINRMRENLRTGVDDLNRTNVYLNSLIAHARSPIVVWNSELVAEHFNYAFEQVTGLAAGDVIGSKVSVLFPSEEHGPTDNPISHAAEGKVALDNVEIPIKHIDGSTRIIVWNSATIFDPGNGSVVATIAQGNDVTERKRAEDALAISEERFRCIFNSVTDAIFIQDLSDGTILDVNDQACRLYGYSRDEILDLDVEALSSGQPPYTQEEALKRIGQALSGVQQPFEWLGKDKNGRVFWVLVSMIQTRLDNVDRLLVSVQDITEIKQVESALRKSLRDNQIIFDAIGHPTLVLNSDYEILQVNAAAVLSMGIQFDQIIGRKCHTIFHCEEHPPRGCPAEGLIQGVEYGAVQMEMESLGGTFLVLCTPVFDESGKLEKIIHVATDITSLKSSQASLLMAKEAAESANRAKSEFLANMSHEIRTPLNGVLGMLQLLETTDPNDEQKEYLLGAIRSSNRLTRLLSDILDLSRIEAGRMEVVQTEFNIKLMWDAIRELFEMEARGKGLRLEFGRGENLPQVLIGDETRLRQILFNLVGNAIKFTEKGEIRIDSSLLPSTSDSSVRVLTTVSDTGIGIPEEHLKDIFEPFVQAEGSYTRRFQGAGLGLSIVRRLVKLLGGEIAIDSAPGEGTTVYLSLPFKLHKAEHKPVAIASCDPPPAHVSLRILVAEDDSVSSLTCKRLLEKSGYSVTIAKDGQETLQRLTEQDFDLILMDVQMPVMDGVEATKAIRDAGNLGVAKSRIPIIAMTAYAMSGDKEKFLAAGMDDYISKPVDKAALIEVIERVLRVKEKVQ